jgi:hypothetical protein
LTRNNNQEKEIQIGWTAKVFWAELSKRIGKYILKKLDVDSIDFE